MSGIKESQKFLARSKDGIAINQNEKTEGRLTFEGDIQSLFVHD